MVKVCCQPPRVPDDTALRDTSLHRWAVVLAAGRGKRLLPWIERWQGERRPKQYCTFIGKRSMLQHTLDRAAGIVSPDHVVTVIARGDLEFLNDATRVDAPGEYLEQPYDRGTAAGVFLPLTYILAWDPEASVVIYPSDHYVYPEIMFNRHARRALSIAEDSPGRVILLGVLPDRPETDYGWILPGQRDVCDPEVRTVIGFREKPPRAVARRLLRAGGLWNTMVVASKAVTLWRMAWDAIPDMMRRFQALRTVLRAVRAERVVASQESLALESTYESIGCFDFARDLLQRCVNSYVLCMVNLEWSDWGRPERVDRSLLRLGVGPLFRGGSLNTTRRFEAAAGWVAAHQ